VRRCVGLPADGPAGDVNDPPTGVEVGALPQLPERLGDEPCLFERLPHRRLLCGLAWFNLAAGESPDKVALSDAAADQQKMAAIHGDGHCEWRLIPSSRTDATDPFIHLPHL
jgi:hypothetical protein